MLLFPVIWEVAAGASAAPSDQAALFASSFEWCARASMHITVEHVTVPEQKSRIDEMTVSNDNFKRFSHKRSVTFADLKTGERHRKHLTHFVFLDADGLALEKRTMLSTGRARETLIAYEDPEAARTQHVVDFEKGGLIFGAVSGFSHKKLSDLLTTADKVSSSSETVNGINCVLLTTEVKEGSVSVWLAPDLGNTMQRCLLIKEAGKHLDQHGNLYEWSYEQDGKRDNASKLTTTISLTEATVIDGKHIPVRYEFTDRVDFTNGESLDVMKGTISLSDIVLDPEFESLQAFTLPGKDGEAVSCQKDGGGLLDGFELRDNKVVARMRK